MAKETLYETCQRIVERWQYEKRGGVLIDATSANVYVQVHEALNETNRERLESMSDARALELCFRLVTK